MAHVTGMEDMREIEKIKGEYEALLHEAMMRERRRFVRLSEAVPVLLKGEKSEGYFFSLDVGMGGIRFTWGEALAPGDQVDLAIALDRVKSWIHLKAEVIWQRPENGKFEIGMMFVGVAEDQKQILNKYLQESVMGLKLDEKERAEEVERLAEKRRHQRVSRLFLTLLEIQGESGEKIPGLILDISLGGARLITGRQIPGGTRILLEVELEEKRSIALEGKIVWTNRVEALKKFQHGIEFLHAVEFGRYPSEVKELLETYVHYQAALKELNVVDSLIKVIRERKQIPQED